MRAKRTAALATALVCTCTAGPALAAVAGHSSGSGAAPIGIITRTSPQTITSPTPTTTTTTSTSTATTTTTTTTSTMTTPPPMLLVCLSSVRRVIAARLGVSAAGVTDRQFLAANGMPQCNYLIAHARRGGPRGKVVLTANVDNGPQAHWRLMRKVVEASQIFGPVPKGFRPPRQVRGLGPYASWFPALNQMMAINIHGRYLLTVGVIWYHTTPTERIAITRAVITIYRHIPRLAD
ncbi:MAG TPA: hypothetical protein VG293_08665 [Solirubrobacteraceae bacterium]|nr:hypothetical protein [Solirubrobacteraceae bacterium]